MKTPVLFPTIALILTLGLLAAPAQAQLARSFVSGLGSDTNAPNCTRTAPCRTFQVAHDNTLPGGEIAVLDAGSYGAVTINRAISIINDGVGEAGALVSGGLTGITINAGATDAVTLRGLTIKGIGFGGGDGIVFNSGSSLTIENCVIRSMSGTPPLGEGIRYLASASTFAVSNTQITDNQNGGILVAPSGSTGVSAVLDRVGLYNNGLFGFDIVGSNVSASSQVTATITNSIAGNNNGNGFWAVGASSKAVTTIVLTYSVAAGNTVGLRADFAGLFVGGSTLTSNVTNFIATGTFGSVVTWGNNYQLLNQITNPFSGAISVQ